MVEADGRGMLQDHAQQPITGILVGQKKRNFPQTRLERIVFKTSRMLDFVGRRELTAQIGHPPESWPFVAVKELTDNSLDACEEAEIAPEIVVWVNTATGENRPGSSMAKRMKYKNESIRWICPARYTLSRICGIRRSVAEMLPSSSRSKLRISASTAIVDGRCGLVRSTRRR
jgi:hypothetical protein